MVGRTGRAGYVEWSYRDEKLGGGGSKEDEGESKVVYEGDGVNKSRVHGEIRKWLRGSTESSEGAGESTREHRGEHEGASREQGGSSEGAYGRNRS